MTNLFNARALQRRHRVGDRNGPITLLSPPLKATLALGVVIAIGGGLWATLARIPLTVSGIGVLLPVGHIIAGSIWAIFHILIITLQAFIFMMLTLVYIGQAHDAH